MSKLTEFHLFPKLPCEIRHMIWDCVIRDDVPGAHYFRFYRPPSKPDMKKDEDGDKESDRDEDEDGDEEADMEDDEDEDEDEDSDMEEHGDEYEVTRALVYDDKDRDPQAVDDIMAAPRLSAPRSWHPKYDFTAKRLAQFPISWWEWNTSTYLMDASLWRACKESFRVIRNEFIRRAASGPNRWSRDQIDNFLQGRGQLTLPRSVTFTTFTDDGCSDYEDTDWEYFTVFPDQDLFILQPPKDFVFGFDFTRLWNSIPRYQCTNGKWNQILCKDFDTGSMDQNTPPLNIAFEFDPAWTGSGPGNGTWQDPGLSPSPWHVVRATTSSVPMTVWILDYNIRPSDHPLRIKSTFMDRCLQIHHRHRRNNRRSNANDVNQVNSTTPAQPQQGPEDANKEAQVDDRPPPMVFYGYGCEFHEVRPGDLRDRYTRNEDRPWDGVYPHDDDPDDFTEDEWRNRTYEGTYRWYTDSERFVDHLNHEWQVNFRAAYPHHPEVKYKLLTRIQTVERGILQAITPKRGYQASYL